MSVPTYKRSESKTQFIQDAYDLAKDISQILVNKPKKYKSSYADFIIRSMFNALKYIRQGNLVYITKDMDKSDFKYRQDCFKRAIGEVLVVSSAMYIFLELCKKADGVKLEKLHAQEERVGVACMELVNKLNAVIKSDKERIK